MLLGVDGKHCFARKTSRNYNKEKPSPFLKIFFRHLQPSTLEAESKKAEVIAFMAELCRHPIG